MHASGAMKPMQCMFHIVLPEMGISFGADELPEVVT